MYHVREDTTFVQNTKPKCNDTHSRTRTQHTIRQNKKQNVDEVNAKKKTKRYSGEKKTKWKRQPPSSVSSMYKRNNDNIDGKDGEIICINKTSIVRNPTPKKGQIIERARDKIVIEWMNEKEMRDCYSVPSR